MSARILAAFAALALLAACGSKSSDAPVKGPDVRYTGSVDAALITSATDVNALAGTAAGVAQGFGDLSLPTGITAAGGVVAGNGLKPRPATVRNALLMAQDAFARPDLAVASGTYATASVTCAGGGTVSFSAQQASKTHSSVGDFVAVSFTNCGDGAGNRDFGSFRMTITATTGDEFVADVTTTSIGNERFGLALAFHDFATVDASGAWTGMDGDLGVAFVATVDTSVGGTGSLEFTISGAQLVSASGLGHQITQATMLKALDGDATFHQQGRELYTAIGTPGAAKTESQWDLDAKVCSLEFLGCLNIRTNPTFAKHEANPYPYAGALEVFDHQGDFVRVTALNEDTGAATLEWDVVGVASGSVTSTWACFDDPAACP